MSMDAVFRALADESRRHLLDRLRMNNGQTLSELCADLAMSRQAVSKHLAVLEGANLVAVRRRGGRSCISSTRSRSTTSPSAGSAGSSAGGWVCSLISKHNWKETTMSKQFVYVTYIRTTPQKLWTP